jgi:drug/metabolite transporter (DMT)-like permease
VTASQRPHLLPYLALGAGVLGLGFAAIFVRWAGAPGPVASFYRLAITVTLLALPFFRRVKAKGGVPATGLQLAVLGGLFFAGDLAFWATGVVLSGATSPTLLLNTAPIWVGLGALVLFHERLNATFWIGLVVAMSGALIVLGAGSLRAFSLGLGAFFGLVGGIFHAGYFLTTQRGREILDSLTYFWLAALSSALGLLAVSLAFRQPLTGYSLSAARAPSVGISAGGGAFCTSAPGSSGSVESLPIGRSAPAVVWCLGGRQRHDTCGGLPHKRWQSIAA